MNRLALMTIAACLLLPMGQSMAKKPTCPEHPSCDGEDDPPRPVTEYDNTAQYYGFIFEYPAATAPGYDLPALPRICLVEIVQSNNGMVHYECEPGGKTSIHFTGWQLVGGGEAGYCDLLEAGDDRFREFTPTRYWYRNASECVPGGVCEIRISQISFRGQTRGPGTDTGPTHSYVDLPNGLEDIGRISIRTWAQLVPDADEGNVFAEGHTMDLQYIAVDFTGARKGKTLATCRVDLGTHYYEGEAQLITKVLK